MREFLVYVLGLALAVSPWFPSALAAPYPYRETAFQENFYGVKIRANHCWIVGYYGTILYSRDRGTSWELQRSGSRQALFQADFVSDKKGWISGGYGTILHTQDGGQSWSAQASGTDEHLFSIDFIDEREGWAVGSRGTLLHTDGAGAPWINRSVGADVILNRVSFVSPERGWTVGEFGVIYHTKNRGKSWIKQKSPIEVAFVSGESRNLFALLFPDSRAGWAFGLDGAIIKTENGERWKITGKNGHKPGAPANHHLFSAAHFDGKLWAVGERGAVIVSQAGKENWSRAPFEFPPVSLNGIDFGPDGFGLIVGNRGAIFRTLNGGQQWQRMKIVPQGPGRGISQVQ